MKVVLLAGSATDAPVVRGCAGVLGELGISHEAKILSAHRTPAALVAYLAEAEGRGAEVVIAMAGMAAHLAGVVAAHTRLPVLGVPVDAGPLKGVDALLSTVQMPPGVPVATFGIGVAGGKNAAYFAARMLARSDPELDRRLQAAIEAMAAKVLDASFDG